jgi:transcriptional regulator GlxA family with amidase domain
VLGDPAEQLEVALSSAAGADEVTAMLDRFFTESMRTDAGTAPFERALTALVEGQGRTPVGELADLAGCSPRQLERLFASRLGFPPRTVGRVLRFQQALRSLMTDPGISLGAVAAECGYYDQAHFVRDFRIFSGGVPRGYRGYYPTSGPTDFAPNVVAFVQDTSVPEPQAEGAGRGEETR